MLELLLVSLWGVGYSGNPYALCFQERWSCFICKGTYYQLLILLLFRLLVEQVIVGLDRAVSTMKKSELAIITISPEYGYGSTEVNQNPPVVQPSSTVLYEVEMLDFIRVIFVTSLDTESFGEHDSVQDMIAWSGIQMTILYLVRKCFWVFILLLSYVIGHLMWFTLKYSATRVCMCFSKLILSIKWKLIAMS